MSKQGSQEKSRSISQSQIKDIGETISNTVSTADKLAKSKETKQSMVSSKNGLKMSLKQ